MTKFLIFNWFLNGTDFNLEKLSTMTTVRGLSNLEGQRTYWYRRKRKMEVAAPDIRIHKCYDDIPWDRVRWIPSWAQPLPFIRELLHKLVHTKIWITTMIIKQCLVSITQQQEQSTLVTVINTTTILSDKGMRLRDPIQT